MTYRTKDVARHEIITVLDTDNRKPHEYDINAIVDECYEWNKLQGYRLSRCLDIRGLWHAVEKHKSKKRHRSRRS